MPIAPSKRQTLSMLPPGLAQLLADVPHFGISSTQSRCFSAPGSPELEPSPETEPTLPPAASTETDPMLPIEDDEDDEDDAAVSTAAQPNSPRPLTPPALTMKTLLVDRAAGRRGRNAHAPASMSSSSHCTGSNHADPNPAASPKHRMAHLLLAAATAPVVPAAGESYADAIVRASTPISGLWRHGSPVAVGPATVSSTSSAGSSSRTSGSLFERRRLHHAQ
ncbi:hypothetical protein GGF32_010107 [Allomyces javanicus]|nr:hypothetical protein GGF32_010107 [Allomyces javanicus]